MSENESVILTQFIFNDGYTENINLEDPQINAVQHRMFGVSAHTKKSKSPQDWVDSFNNWGEDDGNRNAYKGACLGFSFVDG